MRALGYGLFAMVALLGCGNGGNGNTGSAKPMESGAAAAPAKGGSDGMVEVELAPLGLKMKVAAGGKGAMDRSSGDRKSVLVDIGGSASLNVSEAEGDFAAVKKQQEENKTTYPFKKWAKEGADMAIVEFEVDGKSGFHGFSFKEVGGKKYVCRTTGLDGIASADLAEKQLEGCDTLAAK